MAINESIYGASDQWINSTFNSYIINKNKVAYFAANQSRLENGVNAGKLSYSEPIDKSLSYCGLGSESALSHVGWIWLDEDNNTYHIMEWQDRQVTNFSFFQQNDSNINMSLSPDQLDYTTPMSRGLFWQELQSSWNHNKYLQPYTLINPNNFVLCIYIYATNSTYSSTVDVDYKTYFSTYKTTHPNIIHAYYVPYFNNQQWTASNPVRTVSGNTETSINLNLRSLCYGQLDEYNPVGKDWHFYSYYFINNVFFGYYSRSPFTIYGKKMAFVFATENAKNHVQIITTGGDNDYRLPTIQYYDGIEEDIIKSIACFGLYFSTDNNVAKTGLLTNNDMYIGILDREGIGHGQYLRGSQTANAPQNNYTDMHESGYDYTKQSDTTRYINDTLFYSSWTSSAFSKMYVLRGSDVSSLANELYTAVSQAPQGEEIERYNQSVFLTQNPIDCVISLKKFPIEIFPATWTPTTPIKLGSYTCNTSGSPLPYATEIFNFTFSRAAQNGLKDWFNESFLDFEQYTKVELSIPFCGTVEIPCCYLYDYDTLEVKLIVDFITGACTAYILSRGITIDSVSGECAVNLPVNGVQAANLDAQIYAAAANRNKSAFSSGLGLIGGLATMAIGIATGGIAAAVAGGIAALASGTNLVTQDKKIEYELQHMQVPLKQISAASGAISQSYDMRCKMRITRPKLDPDFDPEVYADTVGFACLMQGQVKDFTGLTVGDIDLDGVAAPEPVKKMLQSLFAEGVYL